MTKRWKRELRRLDDMQAPTDRIRLRAAQGPLHGSAPDGMPHRRQRITAGLVAAALFVAAGVFAWQALRPSGADRSSGDPELGDVLVVTIHGPTDSASNLDTWRPVANFRLGDHAIDIPAQGFSGWRDMPEGGVDDIDYVLGFDVPAGTPVDIEGDATSASAVVRSGESIDDRRFISTSRMVRGSCRSTRAGMSST
jgi:hypothetical protein